LEDAHGADAARTNYTRLCRHPRPHTPRDPDMSTIACGVLLLAIFAFVFYPQRNTARQIPKSRLDFLREQKDVLYENLRDLNFEYSAGKYTAEDYAAQRAALENETAAVLAEIEQLELHATLS
jgi:hypothetical protein